VQAEKLPVLLMPCVSNGKSNFIENVVPVMKPYILPEPNIQLAM